MTAPKLLEAELGTPPPLRSFGGRGLPDDLLREAVQRLRIVCLVGVVMWAIGVIQVYLVAAQPVTLDQPVTISPTLSR
ncbi:MAG TPA: hypothetical protein VHJ69_11200 [Gemmatimonadales bacterium]|jgi:hypothetical protein|nr:hypothetical protein [Gemmatimonadales bacterium]